MAKAAKQEEEQWVCPITGKCSPNRRHRKCINCFNHCWDCCAGCSIAGKPNDCEEPPEGTEEFVPPDGQ